jgi:hypothetical protein
MKTVFDILRHIINNSNLFAPSQKEEALKIIDDSDPDTKASSDGESEGTSA